MTAPRSFRACAYQAAILLILLCVPSLRKVLCYLLEVINEYAHSIFQCNAFTFGAGANAGTYTCADHVVLEAETHVVATALAEATAIAVSEVYVNCKASDGAYACAEGGTYITDTAYAVAEVRPLILINYK
jgi:hypothetical protein